jgi:hypothetical protein
MLTFDDGIPDLPDEDRRDRAASVGGAALPAGGRAADRRAATGDGLGGHGRGVSCSADRSTGGQMGWQIGGRSDGLEEGDGCPAKPDR